MNPLQCKNAGYSLVLTVVGVTILALVITFGLSVANAHKGATGIVKERMDFMKSMGKATKGIGDMFKGKDPYDEKAIVAHAKTISEKSTQLLDHFPEGSLKHPSEALPVIWESWSEFEQINKRLEAESAKFVETAKNGDKREIRAQFARMGKVCKACHEDFRKPKE